MVETYNSTYKELRIMPYDYENTMPIKYMKLFCNATDEVILEVISHEHPFPCLFTFLQSNLYNLGVLVTNIV